MFASIDEVTQKINELFIFHKINKKVNWKYSNRLRSTSGQFWQYDDPKEKPLIEFSYKLFSKNLDNRAYITDVILHEIAHALNYFKNNGFGHTKEFRQICYKIGADGHTSSDKYFKIKRLK